MKILQINVTANWGSTGKIAESIGVKVLENSGESYIAYSDFMNPSKSKLLRVGYVFSKYLHYAQQRIFDNEGLCSRFETKRFIKEIEKIKPDIIHLHNIHDHWLNYKLLFEYFEMSNVPVVWTFHDCWAFTGHCFHFISKSCYKWKTECYNCPLKNEYPKSLLDRSKRNYKVKKDLFELCKNLTIVSCSEWIANQVRESFLRNHRIEVIHNGVNLNIFKPLKTVDKDNKFRILSVSNVWNKEKGLFDIYKIRTLLPSEYEIVIVGLSKSQIKNLPKGIIGIQRTQNIDQLVELYSRADVLVNPTYVDTFPTVNIEALACGTPVITYETGGSPEAIDEETGVVVPQGDINGLVDAILGLKNNPISSLECRKRAVDNFNEDYCFDKYISLYKSLM